MFFRSSFRDPCRICFRNAAFFSVVAATLLSFQTTADAATYFLENNRVFVSPAITSADQFIFTASPDRSYCIETLTTTGNSWAVVNSVFAVDVAMDLITSNRGEASPPVYPVYVPTFTPFARRCFFTTGSFTSISSYRVQASLAFTGANLGIGVFIQLNDTTLSGGFNTSVTDFNFLELTNTLSATPRDNGVISGKIVLRNAITDVVVSTSDFTVNPQDRIDIGLHDIVGSGVFGSVTLTHNGPAGALKGVVSQYRIISSAPLTFEPVLQQPLLRINGLP